jgi:phospholipase C
MTFNFKTNWRTTTALCIASTMALATTAYAANHGGLSDWDKRFHLNRFLKLFAEVESGKNNNKDKDPSNGVKTASPIKHVIVLIGENLGLDHTFGVYKP